MRRPVGLYRLLAALYRLPLALFPPSFRRDEGRETVETLEELIAAEPSPAGRRRVIVRAFIRLPGALLHAWRDAARTPGSSPRHTGGGVVDGIGRHVRLAVRTLGRSPVFSWTVVALVALGVGATSTIFTVVDHVVLRPLPYPGPERLVVLDNGSHTGPLFRDLQEVTSVESWFAAWGKRMNLTGDAEPWQVDGALVSEAFFGELGARARAGRLPDAGDFAGSPVAVVSEEAWERLWGRDAGLIGSTLLLDGTAVPVVGVVDASFQEPAALVGGSVDIYLPLDWQAPELLERDFHVLEIAGRLARGTGAAAANEEAAVLAERLAEAYPDRHRTRDGRPRPLTLTSMHEVEVRGVETGLGILMAAVAVLLLVACVNVAHLFLARGLGRAREMAVRRALGARSGTLAGQLVIESLVFGVLGGLIGVALAYGGIEAFLRWGADAVPGGADVRIDLRVLIFAMSVSAGTAVLFGLVPALQAVRGDIAGGIRAAGRRETGGRGARAARSGLVVAEIALSLVLVAQAGLLLRSFAALHGQDPGIEPAGLLTLPLTLAEPGSPDEWVRRVEGLEEALADVPGVRAATAGLTMPFQHTGGSRCCMFNRIAAVEAPDQAVGARLHPVADSYFDVLGIEPVRGRIWTRDEREADVPSVVASGSLLRDLYGDKESGLGREIVLGGERFRLVGVAPEVPHYGLDRPHGPALYVPLDAVAVAVPPVHLVVRHDRGDPGLAGELREAVWRVQPEVPVPTVRSMEEWIAASTSSSRFDSILFGVFGIVTLVLAMAGLYGTLLYNVGQRKQELGIRVALGAGAEGVQRMVVTSGFTLALIGTVFGLVGAWAGSRLLESRLFGVEPGDPLTLVAAAVALLTTAVLASWLPARHAGRTDPMRTLRAE